MVVAVPWMLAGWTHSLVYRTEAEAVTLPNGVIGLLTYAVSVAIGWAIGERRAFVASLHERALTAEREQAMRVVQAQVAERARIAREMHDVLAHRISLVAMHSGALAYRTDLTPEQVAETAEVVRESANHALTELRAVLGVLRDVPGPGAPSDDSPQPPQPTLDDLDTLVAEARSGGATVLLDRSGALEGVPEQVSRGAFRIVQEGLTNARKHAPGVTVRVTVSTAPEGGLDDEAVRVTVRRCACRRHGPPRRPAARARPAGQGPRAPPSAPAWGCSGSPSGPSSPVAADLRSRPGGRFRALRSATVVAMTGERGRTRVVIVDDDALVRAGCRMILGGAADLDVVAEAGDGIEAENGHRRAPARRRAHGHPDASTRRTRDDEIASLRRRPGRSRRGGATAGSSC